MTQASNVTLRCGTIIIVFYFVLHYNWSWHQLEHHPLALAAADRHVETLHRHAKVQRLNPFDGCAQGVVVTQIDTSIVDLVNVDLSHERD